MASNSLKIRQQEQLDCLLSYVEPCEFEVVEESSLTWHLLQEGLLLKNKHVMSLGTSKVQVWNIRLSASGQQWIENHYPKSLCSKIVSVLTKFLWQILFAIIALIGSLMFWWITKGT